MPFRTRYSAEECRAKLTELKDTLPAESGIDGVCIEAVDADSFTLAVITTRFGLKITLMRYYGQMSSDIETGGTIIGSRFESAIGIKAMLYAIPIAFGVVAMNILGLMHGSSFLHGKKGIILLSLLCVGMLSGKPLFSFAHRTKERLYCFVEAQLAAEYIDKTA